MVNAREPEAFSWREDALCIKWRHADSMTLPALWLRDNCAQDRDRHSGQRLVDICDLHPNPRIARAILDAHGVTVAWQGEQRPSVYAWAWLEEITRSAATRYPEATRRHWYDDAAGDGLQDVATLTLGDLHADRAARLHWLTRLLQDGIARLHNVPCHENAILDALAPIGSPVETNYGRVFDVRSEPQPQNLAYTALGLGLHTDNPYRDPVPGFQALHCLIASHDGGENIFADGIAIAQRLRVADPARFAVLTRTLVSFRYGSENAELHSQKPLIELAADGQVRAIHYNNRSIAPLPPQADELAAFYAAYRRFAELLREERFHRRMKLAEGELVIFDNHRILHGRTAFASGNRPRHLQGCYLARDSVQSATALLRRQAFERS